MSDQAAKYDIGVYGLAVMGENLVLNMENNGFHVAVFNRNPTVVKDFIAELNTKTNKPGRGYNKKIIGFTEGSHDKNLQDFVNCLKKPRKILLMVRADAVDDVIKGLVPFLNEGDIIIDGGNSQFQDSKRRMEYLEKYSKDKKILFIGAGVSGGEEGALTGPSIMPGGSEDAWKSGEPSVKDIFEKIAAKIPNGDKEDVCCKWVGSGGAGHFVKMVHNGIEYGDMQLICEAYYLMKNYLRMDNDEMSQTFKAWNDKERDLNSYLIEITGEILKTKDEKGEYVVDTILDTAGQKGTGKWTVNASLDFGVPLTMVAEAVFARCLSAMKSDRVKASGILPKPSQSEFKGDQTEKKKFLEDLEKAVYASKIVSYTQGYVLLRAASQEYKWNLNYGEIALMWRGGCIIRSKFLGEIKKAFDKGDKETGELENLLFNDFFKEKIEKAQDGWRKVCSVAVLNGFPLPCITSALAYYDGLRTEKLPANLLQAQRDYFGAHTYQKLNDDSKKPHHTNWTGHGGSTTSNSYIV